MEPLDHLASEGRDSSDGDVQSPRKLPDDLPKSLDDRRTFPTYSGEMEMYDGWQGIPLFTHENLAPAATAGAAGP